MLAVVPVGLLLGFLGPFGTYPTFGRATRYGFWLGMTAAGVLAVLAAEALLPRTRLPAGPVRIAAVAFVSAVPMTFVVAWTMSLLQPGRVYTPMQLPALFMAVAAVQLLVVLATTLASSKADMVDPTLAQPAGFPAALLGRLPAAIGSDIVALETEDHYLRVHTGGGSALILMRMADAVAMLDSRLGAQVHRRWWVAQAAVTDLRTADQKLSLELVDGRVVPVGRTFAAATRARFGRSGL